MGENYNEVNPSYDARPVKLANNCQCYHCNASHPGIKKITNLDRYAVETEKGRFEHTPPNRDDIKQEDVQFFGNGAFTYNYPNTSVNMSTPYFFIMRVVPTGPITVTTEYEVYRNPASPNEAFDRAAEFFESIELEDYDLMNGVQKNLNAGVFVNGPLHSAREGAILHFNRLIQKNLEEHRKEEEAAGHIIKPAQRNQQLYKSIQAQENFCAGVCACKAEANGAACA